MSVRYEFSDWLLKQTQRRDAIGNFARIVNANGDAPMGAYRARTWIKYLERVAPGCDWDETVYAALDAYSSCA